MVEYNGVMMGNDPYMVTWYKDNELMAGRVKYFDTIEEAEEWASRENIQEIYAGCKCDYNVERR